MQIIHIVLGKANPERMNGVNKVVHQLATKQAASGLDVAVWGISHSLVHDYPARNFNTRLFQKQKNPFRLHPSLQRAIVANKSNTVFHLHGGFIPVLYAVARLMRQHGIPFITTGHGAYNAIAMKKNGFIKNLYFTFFERKLLQQAHHIHCMGASEVTGLYKRYENDKAVLIPYGFDTMNTEPATAVQSNHFIIGFCGRLDVYTKGLTELITAFSWIKDSIPGSELWMIGDSSEKKQLELLAEQLELKDRIKFFGALYGAEKENALQQCTVFATVSRNEGLPAAVLEAAAMGLPCLVTKATNTGEAIAQYGAGVVIDKTDTALIADGIISLYQQVKEKAGHEAMRNNARQMISEHYNWQHILNQFNTVYRQAISM